jgi:hypothetical protein
MDFNFQFSYVLLVGIAVVGVFSTIGFFNNADAASVKMSENVTMNSSTSGNMSMTNNQTSIPSTPPPTKTLSPLAQVASGILPNHVKCGQGYGLILNLFDSRPACIKSEDMTNFISRGWGHAVT